MDTMLTLGAAARQLGVSKGTISKAIATGKLSATRREDGSWAIDGSELARYLEVNGHRFRSETIPSEQVATEAELRARADLAEQRLADLRSMYEDMKAQRDKWETVAQRLPCPLRNRSKRRKRRRHLQPNSRHDCAAPGAGCARPGRGRHTS